MPNAVLTIDERFCGPPGMGNGGYVAGLLAATLSAQAAEITLRSSVPLMRALQVRAEEAGRVILMDGATVVAEARAVPPPKDQPPATPTHQEAVRASRQYVGFRQHWFPRCFVCGPERPDGLRIFPGSLQGRSDVVAAPWVPDNSLAEGPCIRSDDPEVGLQQECRSACSGRQDEHGRLLRGGYSAIVGEARPERQPVRERPLCPLVRERVVEPLRQFDLVAPPFSGAPAQGAQVIGR